MGVRLDGTPMLELVFSPLSVDTVVGTLGLIGMPGG